MLDDAVKNAPPVVGKASELKEILAHRRSLRSGFGLPVRPQDCPTEPTPVGLPANACGEELCNPDNVKTETPLGLGVKTGEAQPDGPL
ncbi:MAG: hypothetical protein QM770_09505 [Tepidisphaeraceae bacterium]